MGGKDVVLGCTYHSSRHTSVIIIEHGEHATHHLATENHDLL